MATSTPSTSTTAILVLGPAPASQVNHCLGQGSVEGSAGQRLPWPGVSRGAVGRHPSRRIYATVEPKAAETYARARPHARAYTHTKTHTHTQEQHTHTHTNQPKPTHQRSPSSKITKHHRTLPMSTSRCLFPSVFFQVSFSKCRFSSVFSQVSFFKRTWKKTLGKRHLGKDTLMSTLGGFGGW